MTQAKRWTAKAWAEGEVQDMIDGYGNTRERAATFVLELLHGGEYRDELTDDQVDAAIIAVRKIMIDAIEPQ